MAVARKYHARPKSWKPARKIAVNAVVLNGYRINSARIAKKLGMGRSYLCRIFSGDRPPRLMSVGLALKLASSLNCTVEELIVIIEARRASLGLKESPHGRAVHTMQPPPSLHEVQITHPAEL